MTMTTDTTLLGFGGSNYGTHAFPGAVPVEQVEALFDFKVGYSPIYVEAPDGGFAKVPNRQAILREDNGFVLNPAVSLRHGIHQFSDVLLPALASLLDTSGADLQIAGAGLLDNGGVGWVQVQAPETVIAGDTFAPTVTVASSHTGKFATSYRCGMHRFRCSNEIGVLRHGGVNVVKIRHTMNSKLKLAEARSVLELMWAQTDEFAAEVEALVATTVNDDQFSKIMSALNPRPGTRANGEEPSAAAVTRWENRESEIRRMYREDERVAEFRGTGWGVVQAFSTWRQHERPFRSGGAAGQTTRQGRTMHDFIAGKIEEADLATAGTVRRLVSA